MRKYSILDMKKIASAHNGKCLSSVYKSVNEKLLWKCKRHAIFSATPANIIYHGKWCPKCGILKRAKSQANNIEDCHDLAKAKGGKCLSKMTGWKDMDTMMIYMRKAGIDIKNATSVLDDMKTHKY